MAENDQAQEKTEEPTQRRLEKAREDGEVLSSKEMFVFASSTAGLLVLTVLGLFSSEILNGWAQLFSFSHPEELLTLKIKNAWTSYQLLLTAAAVFGIPCFIFVVGMQALVGNGLSASSKALGFKFEKLNLIKGLGRIFSVKGLVELIKSVASDFIAGDDSSLIAAFSSISSEFSVDQLTKLEQLIEEQKKLKSVNKD